MTHTLLLCKVLKNSGCKYCIYIENLAQKGLNIVQNNCLKHFKSSLGCIILIQANICQLTKAVSSWSCPQVLEVHFGVEDLVGLILALSAIVDVVFRDDFRVEGIVLEKDVLCKSCEDRSN